MRMSLHSGVALILAIVLISACAQPRTVRSMPEAPAVLLVCERGSVKSLMAASLFNQAASERSLPFRAVSRGVTPDERVPEKIADSMARHGFDAQNFKPVRVTSVDVSNAARVVAIGIDPRTFASEARVPVDRWDDVPAASVDYVAAYESLRRHVELLLDELQAAPR
jgi:protein-tyrosine-phosphatase